MLLSSDDDSYFFEVMTTICNASATWNDLGNVMLTIEIGQMGDALSTQVLLTW